MSRLIKNNGDFVLLMIFIFVIESITAQDLTHFSQNKSSVHGSLSATTIGYNVNGIAPRKDPFSYVLAGNLQVNLKGLVLPFSFVYSNRSKDFRQPFNQFGLSPHYKWITVHLGYRNISFSKYVLGGHTVFGAGVELNPGLFRFGILYGRLQRQTNHAIKINNPLSDTLSDFNRKMISAKIGIGSKETFFDLVFLKAYDDTTKLNPTTKKTEATPAANLVAGINTHIKFSKNLHFEAEGAYSIYTENQNSVTLPFEFKHFNVPIPLNLSTQFYLAFRSSFIYRSKKGLRFALNYRRIDPDYKSMGVYFINSDLENLTISTGFTLLKRKMRFKGSLGLERNNLKLARSATTKKIIGSTNLSYDPVPLFGININYSNYSLNQTPGRMQIADSIKIYQTNSTFVIMPHLQFRGKGGKTNHFITLLFTQMGLNDKNPATEKMMNFTTTNFMLSYNLSFTSSGLSFITSLLYNKINMVTGQSSNNGVTLGINKSLLKNKLNLSFNTSITQSKNAAEQFLVITPTFSTRYRVGKHHSFRLKLYSISNRNQTDNSKTFSEKTGDFSYVFTF